MTKKWTLLWLSGLLSFISYIPGQAQEKYPSRTIELVAPTRPGGTSDIVARVYSEDLAGALGVPVTVVNREGGAGSKGTFHVIGAKKDGYTLLAEPGTPLVIVPAINKNITYDPVKDLTPIGHLGSISSIFVVRADSPFKTLKELIEFARRNPGKLKNAVGGIGTESNFNMEIICSKEKVKIPTIPFHGGSDAVTALLGGHVDISCNTLGVLGPQIKAGKLRGLAVTVKTRHPGYPDIPTTTELGYPEASFNVWFGLFAPAGIPKEVMDVLVPVTERVFKKPEVLQRAQKVGLDLEYMGPEQLRKYIEAVIPIAKKVVADADLKEQ